MSPRDARRRLKTLEADLTPNAVVLRWLAEVKAHGSMAAYIDALAAGPGGQSPFDRFLELLNPAYDALVPKDSTTEVKRAGRQAMRQANFRVFLVKRVNDRAAERMPLHSALAMTTSELLDALIAGLPAGDVPGGEDPGRDRRWQAWLDRSEWLLGELYTEAFARWIVEDAYLEGVTALFPDLEERCSLAVGLTELTVKVGLARHARRDPDPLTQFLDTTLEHILTTALVQGSDLAQAFVEQAKHDLYAQFGRALLERRQEAEAGARASIGAAVPAKPMGDRATALLDRGRRNRSRQRGKSRLYEGAEV